MEKGFKPQMKEHSIADHSYSPFLWGGLLLLPLYLTSLYSYLLFHSLSEMFSIIIAFAIFIVAWNSRRFVDDSFFVFLGIAYLFFGGLDLLHTLALHAGQLLSREQLLAQVWGYDYYGDLRVVDAAVKRLRAKVRAAAPDAEAITTVRGVGYKLVV